MLQRKNGDQETYKKSKQQQADNFSQKRSADIHHKVASNKLVKESDTHPTPTTNKSNPHLHPQKSTPSASLATGFKTIRSKRKAYLQTRDLKKKLKRFDVSRELPSHPSVTRKNVRDVVQEPPKLHQPKKTFKKVKDEREELKSWSDYEDELEQEESS